jgi:CheY-like chemotaxis protein
MTSAKILIVNDQESDRCMLSDIVVTLGHNPVTAVNEVAALEQLQKDPPDLILLGVRMPRMNGIEVPEYVRNDHRLRHLPVVIISEVDEAASLAECILVPR